MALSVDYDVFTNACKICRHLPKQAEKGRAQLNNFDVLAPATIRSEGLSDCMLDRGNMLLTGRRHRYRCKEKKRNSQFLSPEKCREKEHTKKKNKIKIKRRAQSPGVKKKKKKKK